jgi:transcriptional regulator with XRE-family HTH domain
MTDMETSYEFKHQNRKNALRAWLAGQGISKVQLARYLGVSPSWVTRILGSDHAPMKRIQQLVDYGIPKELLPQPSAPPGRPRKKS